MATSGHHHRLGRIAARERRRLLRFELLGQRRVLASLTGHVFHDADDSFHRESSEPGLGHRVVYVDLNDDGRVTYGEPIQLTKDDGSFLFEDLAAGEYVVRLFNGTSSQAQNTPFKSELVGDVSVSDAYTGGLAPHVDLQGDQTAVAYTAAGVSLTEVQLDTEAVNAIDLPGEVIAFQSLGNRQVLAVLSPTGNSPDPPLAVLVSFADGSVETLGDGMSAPPRAGAVAVNEAGDGLLVPAAPANTSVPLHTVQFDAGTQSLTTSATTLQVDSSAQLWANASSPTILVSQPAGSGTQVALWSTATDSVVPGSDKVLNNVVAILAYDDANGLLLARASTGEAVVLDAANHYAVLHNITEFTGPVTMDGHRDLIFGMIDATTLAIFDVQEGEMLIEVPLEAAAGVVADLAIADGGNRIVVRRPGMVTNYRIDRPDGHRVTLAADEQSKDLLFGMLILDDNDAPAFNQAPEYTILEDHTLHLTAPGITVGIPNPEMDQYVTLQMSQAAHGTAVVRPDGSLSYIPQQDFFGVDTFEVLVSDGRDDTNIVTVKVNVQPVNDRPGGLNINIPPFPENLVGPAVIGTIEVDDVDGDPFIISIDDPRFVVVGNEIILVGGAELDHELEPEIEIGALAESPESGDSIGMSIIVEVQDADDAPTDILPHEAEATENLPGVIIAELSLVDQDSTDGYTLTTSDSRFEIVGMTLKLVDDVALDHEAGATVAVPITVNNADGQPIFGRSISVTVTNAEDPVTDILLSGQSVREMVAGYGVGTVTVVDQDTAQNHDLSVDDSRFEIVGTLLKLRDGVFVRRADQAEIVVNISATSDVGDAFSKQFVLTVLENLSPWSNPEEPHDVDSDGIVSPIDALIIINSLNNEGPRELIDPINWEPEGPRYYDVNGDGRITPLDALIIINFLNRQGSAEPVSGSGVTGEGEDVSTRSDYNASDAVGSVPPLGGLYGDDDDDDDWWR